MPDERVRSLSYAVRPRVVLNLLGHLFVALGALALVPAAAALVLGEPWAAVPALAAAGLWAALGLPLRQLQAPGDVWVHEALVVVALIFALSPLVMWGPLMALGLAPSDAVFEAVSAVTTTGLSTLGSAEGRSRVFLFTRAWMQWYGGLGIAALSVALVMGPGVAARRLGAAGLGGDWLVSARLYARRLLAVYAVLTAIAVLLLAVLGAAPFDAVALALAAVSTGGFAPHDASLAALPGVDLRLAVVGVSLAGAVPFALYADLRRRGAASLVRDPEVRALLACCALGAALLAGLFAWHGRSPVDAVLMALSAQTTAGFASVDVADLSSASKLLLIVAMLVGGGAGSTAGGIKILRVLVALRLIHWIVVRTRMPSHAVAEPRLGGEVLQAPEIARALGMLACTVMLVLVSWLPFLVLGYAPLDALFEVVSAVGTVGLSAGLTGPALPAGLRAVLCLDMWLGRLEIVAALVLLSPRTWLGRRPD